MNSDISGLLRSAKRGRTGQPMSAAGTCSSAAGSWLVRRCDAARDNSAQHESHRSSLTCAPPSTDCCLSWRCLAAMSAAERSCAPRVCCVVLRRSGAQPRPLIEEPGTIESLASALLSIQRHECRQEQRHGRVQWLSASSPSPFPLRRAPSSSSSDICCLCVIFFLVFVSRGRALLAEAPPCDWGSSRDLPFRHEAALSARASGPELHPESTTAVFVVGRTTQARCIIDQ
jgi:hypothetical protein